VNLINKRTNLSRGVFNLPITLTSECEIPSIGVDFDAVEFNDAIKWLGASDAVKSCAADRTLCIRIEPLYSAHGKRENVLAVFDAGVKIDAAEAEAVFANFAIEYETYA
jgi:hypothetical protein